MNIKVPKRHSHLVFAFFMAAIMAILMSAIIVAVSSGVNAGYLQRVIHAYTLAMPSAFICVLFVRPVVVKLVSLVVATD
ncbi:DUF2798 domain-containing protein [Methylotenera sp. L2L1]|uniref:DUF2798 domain-containing protein n=1 Tax=Methylotenera sp. L2L1 TaxID=1502770 RepID=UPI0005690269|nr:DUF2798 domain-containing protein [Methylotenera sp. L2L1]